MLPSILNPLKKIPSLPFVGGENDEPKKPVNFFPTDTAIPLPTGNLSPENSSAIPLPNGNLSLDNNTAIPLPAGPSNHQPKVGFFPDDKALIDEAVRRGKEFQQSQQPTAEQPISVTDGNTSSETTARINPFSLPDPFGRPDSDSVEQGRPKVSFYPGASPSEATGARMKEIEERQGRKLNPNFNPELPESETNKKYVNHKRSFLKFLGAAGMGALKGAATGNLAGALGGAIAGTIGEGVDPNFFRKQTDAVKLGQLQSTYENQVGRENQEQATRAREASINEVLRRPEKEAEVRDAKVRLEEQKFKGRLALINRQADIRSGEAKLYVDDEGKLWKQFLKPDSTGKLKADEPIVGPNGEQDYVPGEQSVQWYNPRTQKTETLKGRQAASADATIATSDAGRQQDADKFNSSQALEAAKTNAKNQFDYSKAVYDRLVDMGKTNAEAQGALSASQGLFDQMSESANALGQINPEADPKKYADAKKTFDDLQEKFYQQISKTTAGATLVQQMASQGINRPPTVTFNPIQATRVGGKSVSRAKDPLGLFQ